MPRQTYTQCLPDQIAMDELLSPIAQDLRVVNGQARPAGGTALSSQVGVCPVNATAIAIYGGGGFAREIAASLSTSPRFKVVCFIDDAANRHPELRGLPVLRLDDAYREFPGALLVAAIGNPNSRRGAVERASLAGFRSASIVHPSVVMMDEVEMGDGVVVCAGSILTTNIRLGEQVQINLDCTIGHDVVMGAYATLAPGVHVSGNVHIDSGAYVGTGAVIINGTEDQPLTIGRCATVGAGACVTRSVPPDVTVVGVPARAISHKECTV